MDSQNYKLIDVYCSVLSANQDVDELEKVINEIIPIPKKTVPMWTALAIYSESKGKRANAFNFTKTASKL